MQPVGPSGPELPRGAVSMSSARAGVLDALRERDTLCTVKELADTLGLHANTVREHLDALVEARLVMRTQNQPHGRGRPALLYRALHDAGDVARDYEALSGLLASALAKQPDAAAVARQAGRDSGQLVADKAAGRTDRGLLGVFDTLGFEPDGPSSEGEVVLHACPILDVARRHPDVVCSAHLGLAEALVVAEGLDATGIELEPMSMPGGCLLRVPSMGQTVS